MYVFLHSPNFEYSACYTKECLPTLCHVYKIYKVLGKDINANIMCHNINKKF